jgi:hypothetical protein
MLTDYFSVAVAIVVPPILVYRTFYWKIYLTCVGTTKTASTIVRFGLISGLCCYEFILKLLAFSAATFASCK